MRRPPMTRVLVGVTALMLTLAACEMNAEVVVNPDGSGTFGFSFAIEDALAAQIPGGENPLDGFREEFADDGLPWQVEEFTGNGMTGVRATLPFASIEDLRTTMTSLETTDSPGAFDDSFRLERTDGGWVFEATGEAPGSSFGGDLGGDPSFEGGEFAPGFDPSALAELFDISVKVTLPGASTSTNATETIVDGGSTTFVWALDPASTTPVAMRAETVGSGAGGFPMVPVGIGVLLVGAAIIAAARFRRPTTSPDPVFEGYGDVTPTQPDDDELAV